MLTYTTHKTLTVDVVAHDQSAYVLSASNFLILVDLLSKVLNLPMFFLNLLTLFIAKGFVTVLWSGCVDRMLLYTFKIYEFPGGKNAWK